MKPTPSFALMAALALLGCSPAPLYREAGDMDPGNFGNATMTNTLAASGQQIAPNSAGRLLNGQYAAWVIAAYRGGARPSTSTPNLPLPTEGIPN